MNWSELIFINGSFTHSSCRTGGTPTSSGPIQAIRQFVPATTPLCGPTGLPPTLTADSTDTNPQ